MSWNIYRINFGQVCVPQVSNVLALNCKFYRPVQNYASVISYWCLDVYATLIHTCMLQVSDINSLKNYTSCLFTLVSGNISHINSVLVFYRSISSIHVRLLIKNSFLWFIIDNKDGEFHIATASERLEWRELRRCEDRYPGIHGPYLSKYRWREGRMLCWCE